MSVTLETISSKHAIDFTENQPTVLRKLSAMIAEIYVTFSKISQDNILESAEIEKIFKKHSFDSAALTRSKANPMLYSTCLSMIVFVASNSFPNGNDQKFVQMVAEKFIPATSSLFDCGKEGDIKTLDMLAQNEMHKMQDKSNRAQSDKNIQEQFAQVLQAEIQRLRSASASIN